MSNLRVATLGLAALVMSALLAACTQSGSGGLQPGATEGTFALNIVVQGAGTVVIEELDLECTDDCTYRIGAGVTVEMQTRSGSTQGFAGWHGACSGTGTCTVTMDGDKTVTAVFADNVLVLDLQGDGQASVRIEPGEDCTADCVRAYDSPVQVSLLVNPDDDSEAAGFGGACSESDRDDFCVVTIQGRVDVSATVNIRRFTLDVGLDGSGSVTGSGIDCPGDCTAELKTGTSVTLTADPAEGWDFVRWNGGGCGTDSRCTVQMNADEEVTAVFRERFLLATTVVGEGTVSGGGIDCSDDCEDSFSPGTSFTLTADPNDGWRFAGWSGACSGTGGCTVTMDGDRSVTATFEQIVTTPPPPDPVLTVDIGGEGTGTISGPNIDCPRDCSEPYPDGTSVTITAQPTGDSTFGGWSGACSDSGPTCELTINSDVTVTAAFDPPPPDPITLDVAVSGGGSGTVTGGGIDCEPNCHRTYPEPTDVTLTANPSTDSVFAGWGGDCAGAEPQCPLTVDSAMNVTATFEPAPEPEPEFVLNVVPDGDGSGTVSADGIDCPDDCDESYAEGTPVTLTAVAGTDSQFDGWAGCDTEANGECSVEMNGPRNVIASFSPLMATFTLDLQVTGPGSVAMDPSEDGSCSGSCTETYQEGQNVTLTAQPDVDATFTWGGDCPADSDATCDVQMDTNRSVTVTFQSPDDPEGDEPEGSTEQLPG